MALSIFDNRQWSLATVSATQKLAGELASATHPGDVLLLQGPVGVGKTTLTGFLLQALGAPTPGQSPSYALHRLHHTPRGDVHHYDLYRLRTPREFESLDPWDGMDASLLTVVEWADTLNLPWPSHALWLTLSFDEAGQRHAWAQRKKP